MLGALFCCLVVVCLWGLWFFVGLVVLLSITSPKKGMDVHLKYFSLFNLRFTSSHLCSTLCTIASWSVPSSAYPITNISSTMPKMFGINLNVSSILHWNMSPAGTAQNRSHLYLYLPNWHTNVVRYDDFSSNFRLWYPELPSIIDIYLTLLSLGSILFNVGPLCIGLIMSG